MSKLVAVGQDNGESGLRRTHNQNLRMRPVFVPAQCMYECMHVCMYVRTYVCRQAGRQVGVDGMHT